MSDQIEIQLPKTRVNESESFIATAYFRTRATKVALAPTTIRYRIDCITTKTAVLGWTSVSAAANVDITITSSDNSMQDDSNLWERKQLIVQADQGLSTQTVGKVVWLLDNLEGIGN